MALRCLFSPSTTGGFELESMISSIQDSQAICAQHCYAGATNRCMGVCICEDFSSSWMNCFDITKTCSFSERHPGLVWLMSVGLLLNVDTGLTIPVSLICHL